MVEREAHERQLAEENNRYFTDVALAGQQGRDVKAGSGVSRLPRHSPHSCLDVNNVASTLRIRCPIMIRSITIRQTLR